MSVKKKRKKCWSVSVGAYGSTIRLAEREPQGVLYLLWWDSDGKQLKKSLGHRDRERGKQQALEAAAKVGTVRDALTGARLTVGTLIDIYVVRGLGGRSPKYVEESVRKLCRWRQFLGGAKLVESISPSDVALFIAKRRDENAEVQDTTLWHDFTALNTMLNFATKERDARGHRLLYENPIRGTRVEKTANPARHILSAATFESLREAYTSYPWQFGVAADLGRATGHRIGSIVALRWSDIDLSPSPSAPLGRIRWKASKDKKRNGDWTPLNELARTALEFAKDHHPAIGEAFVLPSPKDTGKQLDTRRAGRWLRRALKRVGAYKKGLGYHGLRRAFASDLQHLPDKVVARAGGWIDTRVMKAAYMQASDESVLGAVLSIGARMPQSGQPSPTPIPPAQETQTALVS